MERQEPEPLCSAVGMPVGTVTLEGSVAISTKAGFLQSSWPVAPPLSVYLTDPCPCLPGVCHKNTSPQPGNFPSTHPELDG